MTRNASAAGFTILEALIAMAVLLTGAAGVISLEFMGSKMTGDARVMTRATAIAQDLIAQIQTWDYVTDPRLQDSNASNDTIALTTDEDGEFQANTPAVSASYWDHQEAELATTGPSWNGIATETLADQGFSRYWNVTPYPDPDTGTILGVTVAVIVRWQRLDGWHRIVVTTFVRDPGVTLN